MTASTKTTVRLNREDVLKAVKQFVQRELADDGQYFEEIEVIITQRSPGFQLPDFMVECTKNEEMPISRNETVCLKCGEEESSRSPDCYSSIRRTVGKWINEGVGEIPKNEIAALCAKLDKCQYIMETNDPINCKEIFDE